MYLQLSRYLGIHSETTLITIVPSRDCIFTTVRWALRPTETATRLLRNAVVDNVADVGPLGPASLVQLAAVVAVAVEVLVAVGAPAALTHVS